MKKYRIILLLSLLSAGLLLSSCDNSVPSFDDISTGGFSDEITSSSDDENNNSSDKNNNQGTPDEQSSEGEEKNEPSSEAPSQSAEPQGELVGYTAKGYPITVKNGITYVDGVLVANKTYALPSSYNPGDLLGDCAKAFSEMKSAAAAEGHSLWNASGFRSYDLQASLYKRYSDRDGKDAADRYSARPGHSEHQSGLAIDLNEITSSFADTAAGKWVAENCWRYGFILRYPKGKEAQTGYMYEPWHIRYVGVDVAEKIYNSGLCLEEYYGITSSYSDTSVTVPEETTAAQETTVQAQPEETTSILTVG